ncbi:MAG TPA: hypothetical protein VKM72_17075 [Thermoanaerobaculia bacterium]|nr:hypothetical protein [Thermoanaerobaculia bacterium]
MEPEVALPRLLQLKALITELLAEAWVPPSCAYDFLFNALVAVRGEERTDNETTDQLLLESIDNQCRRYAEEAGRPFRGLKQEKRLRRLATR